MKKYFLLFGFLFLVGFISLGQKRMTVQEAQDSNFIELNIQGLYGFETYKPLNHSGAYFGECIAIDIQNITDTFLVLTIPVGTYLVSEDSTVQNMVVTNTAQIELINYIKNKYRIHAMCGEIHDAVPSKGNNYTLAGFAEDEVVRVAEVIEKRKQQDHIGQLAMWTVTDNVTQSELEEYMNPSEKEPVLEILKEAEVKVNFNKDEIQSDEPEEPESKIDKPEPIENEESETSQDFTVVILAITTGAFFVLSLLLTFLLRKRAQSNKLEK